MMVIAAYTILNQLNNRKPGEDSTLAHRTLCRLLQRHAVP